MGLSSIVRKIGRIAIPVATSFTFFANSIFPQELPNNWKKTGIKIPISNYIAEEVQKESTNAWLITDEQGNIINVTSKYDKVYDKVASLAELLKLIINRAEENKIFLEEEVEPHARSKGIIIGLTIGLQGKSLKEASVNDLLRIDLLKDKAKFYTILDNLSYITDGIINESIKQINDNLTYISDKKIDTNVRLYKAKTITPFIIADKIRRDNKEFYSVISLVSTKKFSELSEEKQIEIIAKTMGLYAETEIYKNLWKKVVKDDKITFGKIIDLLNDVSNINEYFLSKEENQKLMDQTDQEVKTTIIETLNTVEDTLSDDNPFLENLAKLKEKQPILKASSAYNPPYDKNELRYLLGDIHKVINAQYENIDKDPESELIVAYQPTFDSKVRYVAILDFELERWKLLEEFVMDRKIDEKIHFKTMDFDEDGMKEVIVINNGQDFLLDNITTDILVIKYSKPYYYGWWMEILDLEHLRIEVPEFIQVNKKGIFYTPTFLHHVIIGYDQETGKFELIED